MRYQNLNKMSREDINDVVFRLNCKIDEYNAKASGYSDYYNSHFTYVSAGYYESINFGEEILWDSENEPREYDEDTNTYENLENFIKKEFNKFVNKLKKLRFNDIPTPKLDNFDVIDEIFNELKNRKGINMDDFDDETQQEIFNKCCGILEKYN